MKVFIDTNILVSAFLSTESTPYKAYARAVATPNQGIICEQTIIELRRVFKRKFPHKIPSLERFISMMNTTIKIVPISSTETSEELKISDSDDRLILRAAVNAEVDILISGDSHFLKSKIKNPKIMTASEFLEITE